MNEERNYLDYSVKIMVKRANALNEIRRLCKNCGHSVTIYNVDRIICNHCGHWIYKDDKTEFRYKIQENMKKEK